MHQQLNPFCVVCHRRDVFTEYVSFNKWITCCRCGHQRSPSKTEQIAIRKHNADVLKFKTTLQGVWVEGRTFGSGTSDKNLNDLMEKMGLE
jgi:predicted metal-binding protein